MTWIVMSVFSTVSSISCIRKDDLFLSNAEHKQKTTEKIEGTSNRNEKTLFMKTNQKVLGLDDSDQLSSQR